ncbi:MAG: hypothetical protein J6S69_03155 [Proteobacteria bacterium]|nr:hypothetical protein [Pseudomonadota bacterium]
MNEQISFAEIERLLEASDFGQLDNALKPLLSLDDKTRSASENLFIYRTLGAMHAGQKHADDALKAYEKAHDFDPRDYAVLEHLVEVELQKSASEADASRLMEMLIFHRHVLKDNLVMRIFKMIGDAHVASGSHAKARECYEKALDVRPGEVSLIDALLKVSEASGDETAIAKAREKLLSSMTAPESRAAVLVSIGDDYMNNKQDEARAIEMYEEALEECRDSVAAHQRILVISERKSDWERCLQSLESLVKHTSEKEERCKYLLKTAQLYKEKLNNLKRTIQYLNDVLDLMPEKVDIFQTIINLQQGQQDFDGMAESHEIMLKRVRAMEPIQVNLVATIAKKLGDLRLKHFKDARKAADAYQVASDLYPDNVNFHIVLAKLYAQFEDTLKQAIRENREILRLAPDKLDAVSELAKCYRLIQDYDSALCIYRVLNVLGSNDEAGKAIVEKFSDTELPVIDKELSEDIWKQLYPKTLDMRIVKILKIASPAIAECFANDLSSTYNVKPKDSLIDMTAKTVFSEAFRGASKALGFAQIPAAYRCDKFKGVLNAYLSEPSFVVNSNMLAGRTSREIAFVTAKALTLLRPEFYLLPIGVRPLDLILKTITKVVCPNFKFELDKNASKVAKHLSSKLSDDDRKTLTTLVEEMINSGTAPNLKLFMESVEDLSNRVGLVFCDDPSVFEKMLVEESRPISARAVRDRMGSVLLWALSEDYAALRRKLGVTLKV